MTKRVRCDEAIGVRINETELAVMELVDRVPAPKALSSAEIARDLGCSIATVRNTMRSLKAKGLLAAKSRFLRNGGQLENEYSLTDEGFRALKGLRSSRTDSAQRPAIG